jgi:hypothetical protein
MPYTNYYKCSIEGCDGAQRGRGLCFKHYQRLMKYGDPLSTRYLRDDDRQRLIDEILSTPPDRTDCLITRIKSRTFIRVICTLAHGDPPEPKLDTAHTCGKGHLYCVNPHHLQWETRQQNAMDRVRHGTANAGTRNGRSYLTDAVVKKIRRLTDKGLSRSEIGRRLGLPPQTVSKIVLGRRWSHLS